MRYLFIYVMKTVLLSCFFPFILCAVWIEKLLDTKENTHETQSLSLNQKSTSAFTLSLYFSLVQTGILKMPNIFRNTCESKTKQTCRKPFSASFTPALEFSCHSNHQWRRSTSDSGCKYLWLAYSEFLYCHITWVIVGVAILCWQVAAELSKFAI